MSDQQNVGQKKQATGPLRALRVLDLSRVLAAPWCTQLLGDLGADVIKIERVGPGDESRQWGPPWVPDANGVPTRESSYFQSANRNKRSMAVDLSKSEGQVLIRQLALQADICIENYKVGDLARYGLDYASLSALNERLIYCSVTGFGQDGPFAKRPGYDYLFQGLSGLMSVTGERDDLPGGGPQRAGVPLIDLFTGMYASVSILAALHHRDETGKGQYIDLSLLAVSMALSSGQLSNYMNTGKIPQRTGNASPAITPYGVFPCADGDIIIASANQGQFSALSKALGHPEWATDPRFVDNPARMVNLAALRACFAEVMCKQPRAHWEEVFLKAGVPAGPINDYAQAMAHPQVQHLQTRFELPHGLGKEVPLIANPIRLSASPVNYRYAPPLLGQHTDEILQDWLGLADDEIAGLKAKEVIAGRD